MAVSTLESSDEREEPSMSASVSLTPWVGTSGLIEERQAEGRQVPLTGQPREDWRMKMRVQWKTTQPKSDWLLVSSLRY